MGALGLTGPEGVQGVTGPTGPTGNVGRPGPAGPIGLAGPTGTTAPFTGDNTEILTGGTLGETLGENAQIQLVQSSGALFAPTTPLYMGPGNGASGEGITSIPPHPVAGPQTSVEVPTPGGTAFNLTVSVKPSAPIGPPGTEYTFILCNEADCDITMNPYCRVRNDSNGNTTFCSSETFDGMSIPVTQHLDYLPGDTLSIQAYNSETVFVTAPPPLDVSWSLDYHIANADAF